MCFLSKLKFQLMMGLLQVSFNPSQGQEDKLLDDGERLMMGSKISGVKMIFIIPYLQVRSV